MNYQLKIQLKGITKPPVWRRILIPEDSSFSELHEVIQCVFGWENYHLFQFKDKEWGGSVRITEPSEEDDMFDAETLDADKFLLKDYFCGEVLRKIFYEYDFGDSWMHTVTLEAVVENGSKVLVCLEGKGACPPEDCGGTGGYEYMKEVFANAPKGKDAKHFREWLGMKTSETWDAKAFSLDEVNELLNEYIDK